MLDTLKWNFWCISLLFSKIRYVWFKEFQDHYFSDNILSDNYEISKCLGIFISGRNGLADCVELDDWQKLELNGLNKLRLAFQDEFSQILRRVKKVNSCQKYTKFDEIENIRKNFWNNLQRAGNVNFGNRNYGCRKQKEIMFIVICKNWEKFKKW
jgi:hypothetical protein